MSGEQNIAGLLGTAMEKLGDMVQVNTVIGQPIFAGDTTIIPISKVSLGFVAGGQVSVISRSGGNLIVEIRGARVAVDSAMAARILV